MKILQRASFIAFALFFQFAVNAQKQYLIIGTYTDNSKSEGIYVYEFNPKTGEASEVSHVKAGNPSYVAISKNGNFLYSVNESDEGKIASFSFDKKKGALTLLNTEKNNGSAPCYVELDQTGKWLFCGNYSSGDLTLHPISLDGSIGTIKQVIKHSGSGPNKDRQMQPHVHCTLISKDNRFLYVPDLGIDKVMIYPFNAAMGALSEKNKLSTSLSPGAGPRHITFSKNGKYAYLIEELSGAVDVFKQQNGQLIKIQNLLNLPANEKGAGADIHLAPDGKFLYASQRSNSTLQIYKVNPSNGKISYLQAQPTGGNFPRNFTIHPSGDYLLAANQRSDDVVIFKRNKNTGMLTEVSRISVGKPVCLKWIL